MRKLRGYIFVYLGTYYCFVGGEAGTESEVGEQDASGTTLGVTGVNTHEESAQSGHLHCGLHSHQQSSSWALHRMVDPLEEAPPRLSPSSPGGGSGFPPLLITANLILPFLLFSSPVFHPLRKYSPHGMPSPAVWVLFH